MQRRRKREKEKLRYIKGETRPRYADNREKHTKEGIGESKELK
jgi:hypothetical protein